MDSIVPVTDMSNCDVVDDVDDECVRKRYPARRAVEVGDVAPKGPAIVYCSSCWPAGSGRTSGDEG